MPESSRNPSSIVIDAASAPIRTKPSTYPEPFFSRMNKRQKQPLGDLFGLKNFGVNLTTLRPGGVSSLLHRHSKQDEFIFILDGNPTLVTDSGEFALAPGMCAGFRRVELRISWQTGPRTTLSISRSAIGGAATKEPTRTMT